MSQNKALIHFSIQVSGGKEAVAGLIKLLGAIGEIEKLSSIYKKANNRKSDDFHGKMEGVVKIKSRQETAALDAALLHVEYKMKELRGNANTNLKLLAHNQEVVMTPGLTLPAPALYSEPLIIRCAAEVWPTYLHPIVQRPLQELAQEMKVTEPAEFLWQGKSFIAF